MLSILRRNAVTRRIIGNTGKVKLKSTIARLHVNTKLNPKRPFSSSSAVELRNENDKFMLVFPDIVRSLTDFATEQNGLEDVKNHLEKVLEYNVPNGDNNRGLMCVLVYKDLIGEERHTHENIRYAYILGWILELLQSAYLIADDIIDCSQIRRNKACWYTVDSVQSVAVNDVLMIQDGCFVLLKRFFGHLPCYMRMFHLIHETATKTFIGQSLDFHTSKSNVMNFSMKRYQMICDYKTSYFAFYTPIAMSMLLAGYDDIKLFENIKEISHELGHLYQVQNDYLDSFGEIDVLKKPGTDIEDGKCTWLAVMAMKHGSNDQRGVLEECYGKNDPECINKVKQVYDDLDMPEMYRRYVDNLYKNITLKIKESLWSHSLLHEVLMEELNRTKAQPKNSIL